MIKKRPHLPLIALLFGMLGGCGTSDAPHTTTGTAFGHPLELTIRHSPEEEARKAADTAITDLQFVAEVSHPWKPGPLGRTNQMFAFGAEFSANPSILPMLRKAGELEKLTRGYYAPGLGGLQRLWGFHTEFPQGPIPSRAEIDALLAARPSLSNIRTEGIRMHSDNPALRVDFGALAQGHAIDTAMQRLRESGIRRARLDNGGVTSVLGEQWQAQPGSDEATRVKLHDGESMVTLSIDDQFLPDLSERYHPYINPQEGKPSVGLRAVSVIHHEAATAAALAQALLAGGEEKLSWLLEVIPVEYALVVTEDGRQITTEAMAQRLVTVQ